MPFDFESEHIIEEALGISEQTDKPKAQVTYSAPVEAQDDEVMDEVEWQLDLAAHYNMILKEDGIFDDPTRAGQQVQKEVRDFIRTRLRALVGKAPEKVEQTFTDDEVVALKAIAAYGTDAGEIIGALINKLGKQGLAVKSPKPPEPKKAPELKKPIVTAPKLQQHTAPKQVVKVKPPKAGPSNVNVPPQHKDDPTLKIEGNKIFIQQRNQNGEPMWEKIDGVIRPLMKDITPAAKPVGIKPATMPSEAQMADYSQRVIDESKKLQKGDNLILSQLGVR